MRFERMRALTRGGLAVVVAVGLASVGSVASAGILWAGDPVVLSAEQGVSRPSVVADPATGRLLVAWRESVGQGESRLVAGTAPPRLLGPVERVEPPLSAGSVDRGVTLSADMAGGGVLAAWARQPADGSRPPFGAALVVRRLGFDGAPLGPETVLVSAGLVFDGQAGRPCLVSARDGRSGNVLLVWIELSDPMPYLSPGLRVVARVVSPAGVPVGDSVELATMAFNGMGLGLRFLRSCTTDATWNPESGEFLVVWSDDATRVARLGPDGVVLGRARVAASTDAASIAAAPGGAAIAVFEAFVPNAAGRPRRALLARGIRADGSLRPDGPYRIASPGRLGEDAPRNPDVVARAGGGAVIVWDARADAKGTTRAVFGRLVRIDGRSRGRVFRVSEPFRPETGSEHQPDAEIVAVPGPTPETETEVPGERYLVTWLQPTITPRAIEPPVGMIRPLGPPPRPSRG